MAAIKMNCIGRDFSRIEGVRANVNVLQPYFCVLLSGTQIVRWTVTLMCILKLRVCICVEKLSESICLMVLE